MDRNGDINLVERERETILVGKRETNLAGKREKTALSLFHLALYTI